MLTMAGGAVIEVSPRAATQGICVRVSISLKAQSRRTPQGTTANAHPRCPSFKTAASLSLPVIPDTDPGSLEQRSIRLGDPGSAAGMTGSRAIPLRFDGLLLGCRLEGQT